MAQTNLPQDLVSRIIQLERDVQALQTRGLGNAAMRGTFAVTGGGDVQILDNAGNLIVELGLTTDGRYGLRVNDTAGNPQIRAGQLAAGGYGLEAISGGTLVPLSTLAFGPAIATVATAEVTSSLTFTNLATVGPTVTVTIGNSGKAWVFISCTMAFAAQNGGGMGFDIGGATSVAANTHQHLFAQAPDTNSGNFAGTRAVLVTGLNPGSTNFQAKYFCGGPLAVACSFRDREIAVVPY